MILLSRLAQLPFQTAAEKAVEDGLKAVTGNSTSFGYQVEADSISAVGESPWKKTAVGFIVRYFSPYNR